MSPEVESLSVQSLWLKKALPPWEEPGINLSIVNSKHAFILMHYVHIISLKCGSALSTRSNDFIHRYIECVMSRKRKNYVHIISRAYY